MSQIDSDGNALLIRFRATRLRSNGVHAFNQIFERQQLGGEASRHGRRDANETLPTKAKMSAASKGRPKSEAHKKSMSAQRTGVKMPPRPPEWNLRISEGNKRAAKTRDYSYMKTPEYRALQAARTKAAWAEGRRTR